MAAAGSAPSYISSSSSFIAPDNCIIRKDLELSGVHLYAKNLVVFPGVTARITDSQIIVSQCLVILGTLDIARSNISANKLYKGYSGSLKDLHKMVGFTEEQLQALVAVVQTNTSSSSAASGAGPSSSSDVSSQESTSKESK